MDAKADERQAKRLSDQFMLPSQQMKGHALIRATLNNHVLPGIGPSLAQETLWCVDRIQEIIEFWAADNSHKDIENIECVKTKILTGSNEFQVKRLTAILYIPVLYNIEWNEVIENAIESAIRLLGCLQQQENIHRARTLSLLVSDYLILHTCG